jgi:hypothetical protein
MAPGKGIVMPWINGRFYMNLAYGNAVERARMANAGKVWSEDDPELEQQPAQQYAGKAARRGATRSQPGENEHWVTINGIVTSVDSSGTVHAIAAHERVVGPDDKFNSRKSRTVTYRRFTGGQEWRSSVCVKRGYSC